MNPQNVHRGPHSRYIYIYICCKNILKQCFTLFYAIRQLMSAVCGWTCDHYMHDIHYFYSDILPLLKIIHQLMYLPLCYKLFILINAVNTLILLMFSITRGIYCTSIRPGRGIPHMWLSLGLLKPCERNCDL